MVPLMPDTFQRSWFESTQSYLLAAGLRRAIQPMCPRFHLAKLFRVTDTARGIGDGLGSSAPSAGYSWYAGI